MPISIIFFKNYFIGIWVRYLAIVLLLITGCSFKPLYNQSDLWLFNSVTYDRLTAGKHSARATYHLNKKIERMVTGNFQGKIPAKYTLSTDYKVVVCNDVIIAGAVGIQKRVRIILHYILQDIQTNQIKYNGKIISSKNYTVTERQPFLDYLNQNAITINIFDILIEELRTELIAKLVK